MMTTGTPAGKTILPAGRFAPRTIPTRTTSPSQLTPVSAEPLTGS